MQVRDDLPDHKLVLGCVRDSQIHTGVSAFQLFASGLHSKVITVAEVKFLVACNAGEQWEQLLNSQPIFGFDENGTPCFVAGGLAIPKEAAPAPVEPEPQAGDVSGDCAVCL